MMELSREQFEDMQGCGFEVTDSYSGRGMMGRECFGLTGKTADLVRLTLWIADPENNEWYTNQLGWLENVRTDNMAYDMIFYWPSVTVKKSEEDGEDAS